MTSDDGNNGAHGAIRRLYGYGMCGKAVPLVLGVTQPTSLLVSTPSPFPGTCGRRSKCLLKVGVQRLKPAAQGGSQI